MTNRKLLYIFDNIDWKSRMPLAKGARERGFDVTIGLVGDLPAEDVSALDGFSYVILPKPKHKLGPWGSLKTVLAIRTLITTITPDLVHTVTLKYTFLLGLACLFKSGFRLIYTIAGLGFLFRSEGIKPCLLRFALAPFLRLILRDPKADIIFQNPDDEALLIAKRYVLPDRTHLIIGSGVDLKKFKPSSETENNTPLVLMPTRLVHEKGIHIFVEAARLLKERSIGASFQIAGGETKHNPKAISRSEILSMTADGAAKWLGRVDDMPDLLRKSSLIVYPSYYGEGVPRVLLESCAASLPIITTDHPGCREAVREGENGLLVPIKDAHATACAIETLLQDPARRKIMGQKSRELAEKQFDISIIVKKTLAIYE